MATTRNQVIAQFAYIFPDCDIASDLFNDSYLEILGELEVRNGTIEVLLTAETAEYDLDNSVVRVFEAYYQPSSDPSTWNVLKAISLQQMSATYPGWRAYEPSSQPWNYYLSTAKVGNTSKPTIGFYPVPNTSSSGGFPRVQLFCTVHETLSGTDDIPPSIPDPHLIGHLMAQRWAFMRQPESYAFYKKAYDDRLQKAKEDLKSQQFGNEGTFIIPSFVLNTTRRR